MGFDGLARRNGRDDWLPADARGEAQVMQWLAVSENELPYGLAGARAAVLFGRIIEDRRHHWVERLIFEPITGRLFGARDRPLVDLYDFRDPLMGDARTVSLAN